MRTTVIGGLISTLLIAPGVVQFATAQSKPSRPEVIEMKVVKFKHESHGTDQTYTIYTDSATAKYKLVCRDIGTAERATEGKPCPVMAVGDKFNAIKSLMHFANRVCVDYFSKATNPHDYMTNSYACYEIEEAELK